MLHLCKHPLIVRVFSDSRPVIVLFTVHLAGLGWLGGLGGPLCLRLRAWWRLPLGRDRRMAAERARFRLVSDPAAAFRAFGLRGLLHRVAAMRAVARLVRYLAATFRAFYQSHDPASLSCAVRRENFLEYFHLVFFECKASFQAPFLGFSNGMGVLTPMPVEKGMGARSAGRVTIFSVLRGLITPPVAYGGSPLKGNVINLRNCVEFRELVCRGGSRCIDE